MFDKLLTPIEFIWSIVKNIWFNIPKNLWQPIKMFVYEPHDLFFSESWHLDITDLCTGLDGGEGLTRNESPQQGNRSKRGPRFGPWKSSQKIDYLVGGFNLSEKYARQIGLFPQVGMKIKNIWNHQPVEYIGRWWLWWGGASCSLCYKYSCSCCGYVAVNLLGWCSLLLLMLCIASQPNPPQHTYPGVVALLWAY